MTALARKAALTLASLTLVGSVAGAQTAYAPATAVPAAASQGEASYRPLSAMDASQLTRALDSARRGDVNGARMAAGGISDPLARKIATWALVDQNAPSLSFYEVDQARRQLGDWPRAGKRLAAAERLIETSGQTPQQIIAWFSGAEPSTPEGAMALAAAYNASGRNAEGAALIRRFWRDKMFEIGPQRSMLARFGYVLTPDDHARRMDIMLMGAQGPAARDLMPLLPADQQALANAKFAYRSGAGNANDVALSVPTNLANNPGLAFERASYFRKRGLDSIARGMVGAFPTQIPHDDAADRIWNERYQLTLAALRAGDAPGAYKAAANTGLTTGADAAEAEFYAGWVALRKLNNPAQADVHFAALEKIGASPITRSRAYYWRGRAAEARGDKAAAQGFYGQAAQYNTTFYGLLAGEKVGDGRVVLGKDPVITAADRARFEGRETVAAARLLNSLGDRDNFRVFALYLDDVLPTAADEAQLVDLARSAGDQDTSMKVVRAAAQRGFILYDRGYPMRTPPSVYGAPEPALVLGITRQESGFDPLVRSGVGARGMMQLMPATAQLTASKMGVGYSPGMLDDPDYNMRLGSAYLGEVVNTFSGSYVMGIASYNAGPGRPRQWSAFCGDPRTASADPIDFIECIPFGETRNYVMRVMEGMQVYRAKLNGGSAPITLSADLKRGGYGYTAGPTTTALNP